MVRLRGQGRVGMTTAWLVVGPARFDGDEEGGATPGHRHIGRGKTERAGAEPAIKNFGGQGDEGGVVQGRLVDREKWYPPHILCAVA